MKASHRLTTISLIAFSLGLTGCASLQGVMTKFKSGSNRAKSQQLPICQRLYI